MEIEGSAKDLARNFDAIKRAFDLAYKWQIEGQRHEADEAFLDAEVRDVFDDIQADLFHFDDCTIHLSVNLKDSWRHYRLTMKLECVAETVD